MDKDKIFKSLIQDAVKNVTSGIGGPFSALITKGDKIIACTTNTVTSMNDPTAHAEVNCIRLAAKKLKTYDLSGCEIYSSCEPCPMCLAAIYWARISKIEYCAEAEDAASVGFDDKEIREEVWKTRPFRKIPEGLFYAPDSMKPFEAWKRKKNKRKY
mgnify:CR=1 FL=1